MGNLQLREKIDHYYLMAECHATTKVTSQTKMCHFQMRPSAQ